MDARTRARKKDRLAAVVITATASLVLAATFWLFLFLLRETWPLLRPAGLEKQEARDLPKTLLAFPGELPGSFWVLQTDGKLVLWPQGEEVTLSGVGQGLSAAGLDRWGKWLWLREGEEVKLFRLAVRAVFRGQERVLTVKATPVAGGSLKEFMPLAVGGAASPVLVGRWGEETWLVRPEGLSWKEEKLPVRGCRRAMVDEGGKRVWLATADSLFLVDGERATILAFAPLPSPPQAMTLLLGDLTCLVAQENGQLSAWEAYAQEETLFLQAKATFPGQGPVVALAPSPRDKNLAVLRPGLLEFINVTAQKVFLRSPLPLQAPSFVAFAPRADRLLLAEEGGRVHQFGLELGHPEVTLGTLFGRVRYEGYREATWVWQSTGGSNAFEPKFSLVPLMLGSVKGALYAMLFSGPLGILAAVYTSQFVSRRARNLIKPAVELLAGVPSVVVGFVAALLLAPWVAKHVFAVLLALFLLPVVLLGVGWLLQRLPRPSQLAYQRRWELGLNAALLAGSLLAAFWLAPRLEGALFPGGFVSFLYERLGVTYDQRNAFVTGLALGFAVLPLIFSVAEEALSNVPESLTSAALSLGASRAKAVQQVVVPAAAPGLLAALLLGFGRALGETMIVLMASGNTPILSFSPFNGMRTMSACIAIELPEAAYGESLYRVLILAALLLFLFTFFLNLLGQLVARKLAARFGEGA